MARRYCKGIIHEHGKIKTVLVRVPALRFADQNTEVHRLRVGALRQRDHFVNKSATVIFPRGEPDKPDLVVGICDLINAELTSTIEESRIQNQKLTDQITLLKNENKKLEREVISIRTRASEEVAKQVENILTKVADYKQKVAGQVA